MFKKLQKHFNPDATDCNENVGSGLGEAYFDRAANRWVFPGEDLSNSRDSSAGPPPTGPMVSAAGEKFNVVVTY
jgi:hypothetical protein